MNMNVQSIVIIKPTLEFVPSYLDMMEEFRKNTDKLWDGYLPINNESNATFLEKQLKRETNPEPPLVAETIYWGVLNNIVVGRISLRHELNENLRKFGGHIGYEVHPLFRQKGIATQMLRELLKTSKAKEIGKLLLTCHPDNIGSNKTILNNGGELKEKIWAENVKEFRNHYWITL